MPEKVRCLRRRTGRRQKLGGAVQGKAAGAAVSGHSAAAGAAEPAGAGGQPSDLPAAGAGGGGGVPGGRQAVRVRQRQYSAIRVLRERPGLRPVSGSGVRCDLSGRGHPAEGAVDAADRRVPAGRQRFSQADLLHLQSGRAGAWVHQAVVYRTAVRAGGEPGGLCLYPGEGHGQHGAAGPAAGLSQDAGGAAAQAAAGVAGGALGHHGGTGVSGVYGRPGALRGSPVDPCDTAL